ncbi:MAG: ATPase [Verrucomicrobiae bacterium]|nr:ATPase [Verrucomicrobiae bacterium]
MKTSPFLRDFALGIALVLICAFFAWMNPAFLSARNLSILMIDLAITAVLAIGMLLVILPGHIDLSVGSGVGLIGGLAAVLVFEHQLPAPAAMGIGLLLALILWTGMGALIVVERIPAFIITLGGLLIFKGAHWLVIHNSTIPVVAGGDTNLYAALTTWSLPPSLGLLLAAAVTLALVGSRLRSRKRRQAHGFDVDDFEIFFLKAFVAGQGIFLFVIVANLYRGLPLSVLILGAVATAAHLLTKHTPFGRYLYAIGGNEEAAFVSGIPVQTVLIGAFAALGGVVALTGFLQTAYAGASTTTVGNLMELDAIAACVIGGASLKGGRGTVAGVLFGALIMAALLNGMTLLAVSPEIKFIARGFVLTLAVWMDVRLGRA